MIKILKKDWFLYLLMSAATLGVIVAAAVFSPPRYVQTEIANKEQMKENAASADIDIPASDFNSLDKFTAARWVGDEVVFMSQAEAAEIEKQIYNSETKEEYRSLMESVVFYNKSIDINRFSWYHD